MAAFSTSFLFFTVVAERHLFGGISVLAPLLAVAPAVNLRGQYPALALGDLEVLVADTPGGP